MAYKSFKGKWQVFGDKPIISILSTGQICFNKVCYDLFVKPDYKYVKLYYDPQTKKIAFEFRPEKRGEFVFPIRLAKTGLLAIVNGKTFLSYFGIKPARPGLPAGQAGDRSGGYEDKPRSYPVHQTNLPGSDAGYSQRMVKGIEIRLDEYIT